MARRTFVFLSALSAMMLCLAFAANIVPSTVYSSISSNASVGLNYRAALIAAADNSKVLSSAAQFISCKTNFTATFIDQVNDEVPSLSNLTSLSGNLLQQTAQLQLYANEKNYSLFRDYMISTYNPELKQIGPAVLSSIRSANLTANATAILRAEYNSSRQSYANCSFSAVRSYALNKIQTYDNITAQYDVQISGLDAQGVDTSAMSSLLQNATAQVIGPLSQGLNKSTNSSQLLAVVRQHCLFNECSSASNYHLAARFEIAKLDAIMAKAQSVANGTINFTNATESIGAANSALASIGSSHYNQSLHLVLWDNITYASKAIRAALARPKGG
ncbi:MAG: hypothetical protein KGH66_03210 [Candidatus Micrarchaeota archaeon]|nr:hypothetical protein [Candidatus Micrarchaeota archaeon]